MSDHYPTAKEIADAVAVQQMMNAPHNPLDSVPEPSLAYKYGPGILFVAGAFCVPKGRAQLWYALVIPLFIAGCYNLRDGGRTPASESSWWWYGEFHQTPASYFFFALSIACVFLLNAEITKRNRARYYAAVEAAQLDADAAWIDQGTRRIVTATSRSHNDVEPAESHTAPPTSTSLLWVPTPERRVRRGGTTLSGVPIKDRRTVNPETLDDY